MASSISSGRNPVISVSNTIGLSLQRQPEPIDVGVTPDSPKKAEEIKNKGITLPASARRPIRQLGRTALNVIFHGVKASAIKLAREKDD